MKTPLENQIWLVGEPIRSTDTIGINRKWNDGGENWEETIAEVLPGCSREDMIKEANLLAAAPQLLKQLKKAVKQITNELPENQWNLHGVKEMQAAIDSAEGNN